MNHISQITEILGDRKTGIRFNITNPSAYNSPDRPMKFCEAVISSLQSTLVICANDIDCLGAKRTFGLYHNDQKFASLISEETQIPLEFIQKAIIQIPVFDEPLKNILLGPIENPDLTIALVKPNMITKLILYYAKLFKDKPVISPYFFMSICANIAVQTFLTNKICISFGCPESRKKGRVQNDEVIVGIPGSLITN